MSLVRFIQDFDTTTKFVIPKEQVDSVEHLVKSYVRKLLDKVAERDERFQTSPVLSAGSFYENSRVTRVPDEFDFMTSLIKLSDDVIFEPGCDGYAKVKVTKNRSVWQEFCDGDYLMSESYREVVGEEQAGNRIMDRFYKLVLEAVQSGLTSSQGQCGSVELDRMESSARGGIELNLHYTYKPNNISKELYDSSMTSCSIGVDLVPVLQFSDISNIKNYVHLYPNCQSDIVKTYGCFLVPKSCPAQASSHQCWRFTFSRSEMAMIHDMDERHLACYRLLKSVYIQTKKYVHTQGHLCSYVIKTAMLHHYSNCSHKESTAINECIIEVLNYLISCCRDYFLPSFFDNNLNIFKVITIPPDNKGKQSGDIKYMSDRPDGVRFVALICRSMCKTPVVHVRWGPFLSRLLDLVRGLLLLVKSTPLKQYDFKIFTGWFTTMDEHVRAMFDVSEGESDKDFFHKLNIRLKVDDECLLGFSAVIEAVEESIEKHIPIEREDLKDFLEYVRLQGLVPQQSTPPLWYVVNLSLTPGYTETTWRTYTRFPTKKEFKANVTLDFFNLPDSETEHDIYCRATEDVKPGDEIYLKFGSVKGAYDRELRPTYIGDVELSDFIEKVMSSNKRKLSNDKPVLSCDKRKLSSYKPELSCEKRKLSSDKQELDDPP